MFPGGRKTLPKHDQEIQKHEYELTRPHAVDVKNNNGDILRWKKNRRRKKMNRASARASLCNNSEGDTGKKYSKGKKRVEVKLVTDLISWSQWCNDTNILVSRYSVSSSPLSTPRSLPHHYSIIQHNGNRASGIRCHGLTHLAPSLQYVI